MNKEDKLNKKIVDILADYKFNSTQTKLTESISKGKQYINQKKM